MIARVEFLARHLLLAFVAISAAFGNANASIGTVAVIPAQGAPVCGGALLELVAELRAARLFAEVIATDEATTLAPFDAAVRFAKTGDAVVVIDLSVPNKPVELATLRLDCAQRLARRRVWTIVVEMLWTRTTVKEAVDGSPAPVLAAASTPLERQTKPAAPRVREVDLARGSAFFGAGPALGINPLVLGPVWDLAMIGGYRSRNGWRVDGRVRWPIGVAEQINDTSIMRLWTFAVDLETSRFFSRPGAVVSPFLGAGAGFNFTLVDVGSRAQDRRWDALYAHAALHAGLVFVAGAYAPFCQFEAGTAHRLTSRDEAQSDKGNALIAAASVGVLFDY